jgi:hypothetical protein
VYKVQRIDDRNFYAMKKVGIYIYLGEDWSNEIEGER